MSYFSIEGNKLIIDKKEVLFDKEVQEVKELKGIFIVLLAVDGSLNNVYGVNKHGDILWKIQNPGEKFVGSHRYPYVGLSIVEDKAAAVDFYGRRMFLDINNGRIIGKDIVK